MIKTFRFVPTVSNPINIVVRIFYVSFILKIMLLAYFVNIIKIYIYFYRKLVNV